MVWEALYDWRAATVSDLQFAGRCLARYLDWLEAAAPSFHTVRHNGRIGP